MPARKTQILAKSSKCTKPRRLLVSEHLEILSFDDFPGVRENRLSRLWACGAVGSALPWHGRGRRFDPDQVHHIFNHLQIPSSLGWCQMVSNHSDLFHDLVI